MAAWIGRMQRENHPANAAKIAWCSLDEGDDDRERFLTYLIAALNQVYGPGSIGEGSLTMLESPQPHPSEAVLTSLINEITAIPDETTLILDVYQLIDSQPVQDALGETISYQSN